MTNANEKLRLQWNDFKDNVSSAFGDLRQDKEFTDVTLACEDGQQVEAHKVVLVASSPFFLDILKRNKHPHPLIYIRGVRAENLMAMVDFFYHGEANVFQENLDSFLVLAEDLHLKGLSRNQTETETQHLPTKKECKIKLPNYISTPEEFPVNQYERETEAVSERVITLADQATNNTDMESLDQQVKSMMTASENDNSHGTGKARICKVCGKEGNWSDIRNHIEANHIVGISVPCGICGQEFRTRGTLRVHKYRHHRNQ